MRRSRRRTVVTDHANQLAWIFIYFMYIGLCSSRPKVREGATLKTMANSFSLNNNCLNYVTVVIYNNRSYATMLLTITVRSL